MCLLYIFSLLWPHFGFDMLFVLSALLFALREAFKLQPVKRETALYSFIFVHIPYFYFSITGYFYFRRVVRNDSFVRRLRRQRSRPCAVGRLGTIERRRTVTAFVKPLLESPFWAWNPERDTSFSLLLSCTNKPTLEICGIARRPMCAYMSV